jgi:DNA-binding LacI/PurR family transcriptional regulator
VARVAGYHESLAAAGVAASSELVATVPWGMDGGARGMELLLSVAVPPTAGCFSDEFAMGALRTMRRAGIVVPEAMSLVAVDDHPMAELTDLTTVRQPVRAQGAPAAELLIEQMHGAPLRHAKLVTQLVVRHSTRAVTALPG